MPRMTAKQLEDLAWDIMAGKVFGTWDIKDTKDTPLVFMPLFLMKKECLEKIRDDGIVHFYEYLDKAVPWSVNGMPMFSSFRTIDQHDANILHQKVKELHDIRKARQPE